MATITLYIPLENGVSDSTGYSYYNVVSLTNWVCGHWAFTPGQASSAFFSIRIPDNVAVTPNASLVLDIFCADNAAHTAQFQTSDALASANLNVGALSSASAQTYTCPGTAYGRTTLTFAVQSTVSANNILVCKVATSTTGTAPTSNMLVFPSLKIDTNG